MWTFLVWAGLAAVLIWAVSMFGSMTTYEAELVGDELLWRTRPFFAFLRSARANARQIPRSSIKSFHVVSNPWFGARLTLCLSSGEKLKIVRRASEEDGAMTFDEFADAIRLFMGDAAWPQTVKEQPDWWRSTQGKVVTVVIAASVIGLAIIPFKFSELQDLRKAAMLVALLACIQTVIALRRK
jgi:hypothetical protein